MNDEWGKGWRLVPQEKFFPIRPCPAKGTDLSPPSPILRQYKALLTEVPGFPTSRKVKGVTAMTTSISFVCPEWVLGA